MLQEQLSKICKEIGELNKYDSNTTEQILKFVTKYQGNFIYPRVVKRKFKISMQEAYELLDIFVDNNLLALAFEVYCNHCDKFQNKVYDDLREISLDLQCEYCYAEINKMQDIIVIYKVIDNAR